MVENRCVSEIIMKWNILLFGASSFKIVFMLQILFFYYCSLWLCSAHKMNDLKLTISEYHTVEGKEPGIYPESFDPSRGSPESHS